MARFEKRRKIQNMFYNRTTVIVLAIITVLLGLSAFSVFQKRQEAYTNAQTAAYEVKTLSARQAKTQGEIAKLETDQGVEEAIRNEYQAAKDGEGLVVIVSKDQKDVSGPAPMAPAPHESLWHRFLGFFKKQ